MTSAEVSEHKPLLECIIRLRAVVLALGESVQPSWWRTGFLNETGLRFLERLYPRSAFHAAVHAAGRAACEIHDQAIGRPGVFHLFRLPEALEAELRAFAFLSGNAMEGELRQDLGEVDTLIARLKEMGDDSQLDPSGPLRVGSEADVYRLNAFRKTAAVYAAAFSKNGRAFPYFEMNGGGRT